MNKELELKKKAETLYVKAGGSACRDLACVLKLFVRSFPFQKLKNEIPPGSNFSFEKQKWKAGENRGCDGLGARIALLHQGTMKQSVTRAELMHIRQATIQQQNRYNNIIRML